MRILSAGRFGSSYPPSTHFTRINLAISVPIGEIFYAAILFENALHGNNCYRLSADPDGQKPKSGMQIFEPFRQNMDTYFEETVVYRYVPL